MVGLAGDGEGVSTECQAKADAGEFCSLSAPRSGVSESQAWVTDPSAQGLSVVWTDGVPGREESQRSML